VRAAKYHALSAKADMCPVKQAIGWVNQMA
jgi:hypothetical protein